MAGQLVKTDGSRVVDQLSFSGTSGFSGWTGRGIIYFDSDSEEMKVANPDGTQVSFGVSGQGGGGGDFLVMQVFS